MHGRHRMSEKGSVGAKGTEQTNRAAARKPRAQRAPAESSTRLCCMASMACGACLAPHLVCARGLAGHCDLAGVGALVDLDGGTCRQAGRQAKQVQRDVAHQSTTVGAAGEGIVCDALPCLSAMPRACQAAACQLADCVCPACLPLPPAPAAPTCDPLQLLDGVPLAPDDAPHDALGHRHDVGLADALLQGRGKQWVGGPGGSG